MDNITQNEAIDQFRAAMLAAGIEPPDTIKDSGKLERFATNGKRKDDSGWYVLHLDGIPAGAFGDWRQGIQHQWAANIGRELNPDEVKANRARMDQARAIAETERRQRAESAAALADKLLNAAIEAGSDHGYFQRKQIEAPGNLYELPAERVKQIIGYHPAARGEALSGRILLAPITINGALSSIEMIDEQGRKSALAGGVKKGGSWTPATIPSDAVTIAVAEGIATAVSVRQATGFPVIAALSSGNLEPVARAIRASHPDAQIIVCADLLKATGAPDPHAVEAARAVGGILAVPSISLDQGSDFNDEHVARGLESVARTIHAAIGEFEPVLSEAGVSGVSGVHASNGAGFSETPQKAAGVSGVSEPGTAAAPSPIPGVDQRPRFIVLDDWHHEGERRYRPGCWYFGVKTDKQGNVTPVQQWICSPLRIEAITFDQHEGNVGRMLRLRTTLGKWRTWAMPCEMLAGDGNILRAELLSMGVELDPLSRNLFLQYMAQPAPKCRIRCATSIGWSGDSFVLPDATIGAHAAGVIFQSGERSHDEFTSGGTLDGWRQEIAAHAVSNPLLALAICGAFAGPVLKLVNAESGGLHIQGDSSSGKSTALDCACSVWGGANFKRSWRATSNGMESTAALFNDCALVLDEISECDPREVGAIVYALGNGTGKARSSRTGRARSVARWRCFVLSSGERSIATTMSEGGHRQKAGQAVRLLDVPAARQFGIFDHLSGFASGSLFADHLKQAAATHYGHAGRAYLERLTRETRHLSALLEQFKGLPEFNPPDAEGQTKRAAGRFALLALAGELASEYGITTWAEGEALNAAAVGFNAWRALRGNTGGNDERKQITGAVSSFIQRHGDSRFSAVDQPDAIRINRAGWFEDSPDGRLYLFNGDGLREALKGFDFKRGLDTLEAVGALPQAGPDGRRARLRRIAGQAVKLYPVCADKLEAGHGH